MSTHNTDELPPTVQKRKSIIDQLIKKVIKQKEASEQLSLSVRQVRRVTNCYVQEGVPGLFSKKIDRHSNNRISDSIRDSYIEIVKQKYPDFGPTFAHEKLVEDHEASFSVETLRQWMISAGLWQPHLTPKKRQHLLRTRRSCVGELIQIDGSLHDWFEGRGEKCVLLIAIDDATSRILGARFAPVENTENYLCMFKDYFQTHGLPVSLYADKHAIFRVNHKGCEEHETQFSRIVKSLGIELIHANTPQAKGRVERVFQTLQDRLVKEMRLANICSIDDANHFLVQYLPIHNKKFSVLPASAEDKHTALSLSEEELDKALAFQYQRIVKNDYSISLFGQKIELHSQNPLPYLKRQYVDVLKLLNNKIFINFQGKSIHAELLCFNRPKCVDVSSKTLNSVVDHLVLDNNISREIAKDAPWMTQEAFSFETCPPI